MINDSDQIVTLAATEDFSRERVRVDSIICRGTAAGIFNITFGNTEILVNTTAEQLTMQLAMNRGVNYIRLNSGPTNARLYVLLTKAR